MNNILYLRIHLSFTRSFHLLLNIFKYLFSDFLLQNIILLDFFILCASVIFLLLYMVFLLENYAIFLLIIACINNLNSSFKKLWYSNNFYRLKKNQIEFIVHFQIFISQNNRRTLHCMGYKCETTSNDEKVNRND